MGSSPQQVDDKRWRAVWDWALFVGGFVRRWCSACHGNVLLARLSTSTNPAHLLPGCFFALLSPFAVLCGLVSVSMLVMQARQCWG